MSEEVIDLDSNNLCISEDVFEKFQVNSMYEQEEIITLPNTSTAAYNVVSDTDRSISINNIPLIANEQIINADLELVSQAKEQSEAQLMLHTIETGDNLQIHEEICIQTTNDVESQHLQNTNDDVKLQHIQSINDDGELQHVQTTYDDVELQHVQTTNDDVEPQHIQTTDDDVEPQHVQTTNDDVAPQHVQTANDVVEPQHVQSTNDDVEPNDDVQSTNEYEKPQYVPTSNEHLESQSVPTINNSDLQFVEISNECLELEQPMEVDSQISGSEMSVNIEMQIHSNNVDNPPTTSSTEYNAIKAVEQHVHKEPKRRGRKKKIPQDIINDMSIEDKMNVIHGCENETGNGYGQSTENNLDSVNFMTPRQQRRRGRKKNSIQDSKIDTSTHSDLISNENVCVQQENDFVSSGTQLESQSFYETTIKNEPKRRGRKKKNIQVQSSLDVSTESQLSINEDKSIVEVTVNANPPSIKSKRGRKPKNTQYGNQSLLNDSEYSIERQMSDSPRKNKSLSSEVVGDIPQKRGRRKNVSTEEQLITLSDLELNSENSITELDVPLIQLSKRRGRPRKITLEETVKEIHQPSEIQPSSDLPEDNIDVKFPSPANKCPGKGKRGRPKRNIIEKIDSSEKIEEVIAQTEMPSSTSTETVKSDIPNEHQSLLDGDDTDDICLSNLRKTLDSQNTEIDNVSATDEKQTEMIANEIKVTPTKRSSKMAVMPDFEYNIDTIMNDAIPVDKANAAPLEEVKSTEPIEEDKNEIDESLLVEDSSRRPTRRRIKQNLHYDEESDEDPFANVELSEDDEPRGKKGSRYYSDDDYIPHRNDGKRKNTRNTTDSSSNSECELEEESKKQKRKRSYSRKDLSLSPRKKGRINVLDNIEENISVTIPPKEDAPTEGDIEVCLESSVIKTSEISLVISPETNEEVSENPTWGTTNEFENFIAKKIQGTALKIKKVSSDQSSVTIPPIEIPTMDAKDIRKTIEMCTQTSLVHTKTSAVQTSSHDDVPMKENVPLSKEQSVKACEFLNGIVKTTAELGVLMTQKSEDFMKKKINTSHVTDTFKMDYCVKKSFLLFKLAKRNLMQMEEDLANQYDQFLKTNKLDTYREEVKTISSKAKADSDSDCEIIEETSSKLPVQVKKKAPKFNPKTVFLNKELSIKIAKKPTDDKKLNIKGKHSVWINDSVILKKVKPTQSFLAQDSRNKKPPDCNVFTKIVNDFFRDYNRQKALSVCAPFVTTEWLFVSRNYVCNYFVAKPEDFPTETNFSESQGDFLDSSDNRTSTSDSNVHSTINQLKHVNIAIRTSPNTLLSLCTASIQKHLCLKSTIDTNSSKVVTHFQQKDNIEPEPLFRLCVNILNNSLEGMVSHNDSRSTLLLTMSSMDNDLKSPLNTMSCVNNDLVSSLSMKTMSCTDNNLNSSFSLNALSFMDNDLKNPMSLQTMSYMKIIELLTAGDRISELPANNDISSEFSNKSRMIENVNTAIQVELNNQETSYLCGLTTNRAIEKNNGIKSLFSLCVEFIQWEQNSSTNNLNVVKHYMPKSLNYIACKKIIDSMYGFKTEHKHFMPKSLNYIACKKIMDSMYGFTTENFDSRKDTVKDQLIMTKKKQPTNKEETSTTAFDKSPKEYSVEDQSTVTVESLSTVDLDECPRNDLLGDQSTIIKVKTLSNICIEKIVSLQGKTKGSESLTINSVNTMSEEAFLNIEETSQLENQYFDNSDCENDFEPEYDFEESVQNVVSDDSNWVTQLQLGELKSGIISTVSNNAEKNVQDESTIDAPCGVPAMVHIKCEPQDEFLNNSVDPSIVKSEHYDELVITLENVTTKAEKECPDKAGKDPIQRHDSSSYDVDAFESFVNSNKMMLGISEEIFSQSALRVRRQHEPDSDDENDLNMSLLVPHTSVPLPVDNAKNTLMESSSDDGNSKEMVTKKKIDKRKKRTKKVEVKPTNKDTSNPTNKDMSNTTKNKPALTNEKSTLHNEKSLNNEVAILTRRMRERIRQEEKKIVSSDSDTESRSLRSRADKKKGEQGIKAKQNTSLNQCEENEIQCNNVDSTEQISENIDKPLSKQQDIPDEAFTGFSAVDQDAISDYQKYIQDVYNKILPKCDSPVRHGDELQSSAINTDDPVEYLECEPTLPMFDNEVKKKVSKKKDKAVSRRKPEIVNDLNKLEVSENVYMLNKLKESEIVDELSKPEESEIINEPSDLEESYIINEFNNQKDANILTKTYIAETPEPDTKPYVDRHGWHCYPIASDDTKIYEHCEIQLDKLPESFVEMYFQYQDVTDQTKEDEEVDRLINLQSLNRLTFTKDSNRKSKVKVKVKTEPEDNAEADFSNGSRPASPASDHFRELTASEDEQENNDAELPPPAPVQTAENNLAKDSLMNDNDTDTETAANHIEEHTTMKELAEVKPKEEIVPKRRRPGPKSKCKVEEPKLDNPDLMLTADKMMKEELTLLHAPIVLEDKVETPESKICTRSKQKRTTRNESERSHIKAEDDSSSEEEKQWVTTKEKLLKRLEKRQETATTDDAKRAKVVSEFIERREGAVPRPKKTRRRSRKMTRKFLERQKQLSVLSKELFGESSDGVYAGKRSVTSYSKGRRNIRKVLDKKSLGRSTVLANMEEFERKRRLSIRQSRLRELLGCEEGVNVLVINDELCLEYDFEEQQPVVTVHPFFTKIMKAHQYEGVKFMWDACFESLAHIAAGHPGGGCILAHCMGLGKTLQVLALLHTVMTHPGVGMHRVLVCCPLSTVLNWVDEIHKWIGPVTDQMKVFELSKLKKTYERAYQLEDWYNGGGIFIIGYELFRSLTTLDAFLDDIRPTIINKIRTALLDPGPDIIICDEGHLLKNDLSVLAVAMSRVVTKRRIILTGTPMQNNLREYYCMVNFVKPNLLGTYAEYSNRFENPIMNGQHRDSSEEDIKLMKARTHILHKVLEGCLQRMEASVLYPYLPKKHEYTVFISLTKCQWDLYKHYLTAYGNKNKQSILKDFHQLQKIWSHPQVLHNFQIRLRDQQNAAKVKEEKLEDDLATEELAASVGPDVKPPDTEVWWMPYLEGGAMLDSLDSSNKFVIVFRILDECIKLGDKVLIFSTSLFTMDALEYFLRKINKWSLGQEYFRLDGSVPPEVRQKWCREFNAENNVKTKLFLISTRAGSLGLNMTAANRVIILDTSWNPAHDIQSIFRVYRFGQKKDCYIYRLVALGTMEQKIYERSVTKQAVSCRVVDEQQIDRHYNMAELTELYRYDEEGSGVQSGVAAGVRDVALLRVARLRAMHAVHEHDSLLRGSEPALPEHERQAAWVQFQYQQEHEHMQMQKGNASKRPYTRVAKLSNGKMLNMEANTQDPDFKPEPKKRGRKPRAQLQEANSAPEVTPKQEEYSIDPEIEQEKIRKIAEILIKFNFQDMQMQTMLPQLVMNVRRMVASGQSSAQCDDLTASIAKILLEKTDITMPTVTDIMCKSVNKSIAEQQSEQPSEKPLEDTTAVTGQPVEQPFEKSIELPVEQTVEQPVEPPVKKYKPGPKCRKGYVYEEIPTITSLPPTESEYEVRAKRRAALAAEKLLEKASKSITDIDDDITYNDSDTDSVPETVLQDIAQTASTTKSQTPETPQTPQVQPLTVEKISRLRVKKLEKQPDNAIMLSDDEESVAKKALETSSEPTPLHPSLLQNANFIKIVAHTYLAGNPMLDEDAATLAARYSTYKALKELERTGKSITGGPIYDIAIKVLGEDILKKLHKTDSNLGAHASLFPSQQPAVEPIVQDTSKITPKTRKSGRGASKAAKADFPPPPAPAAAAARTVPVTMPPLVEAPRPLQSNVVPVGLFKTTISMASSGPKREPVEESILPDDEDVHIVSSPPLAPPSPPSRRNSKPIVIRAVRAGRSDQTQAPPIIAQPPPVLPPHPTASAAPVSPPAPVAPAPPPPRDYGTICLDSDDEDSPPPAPTPVGTWYTVPPKSLNTPTPASNVPPASTTAPIPTILRLAPRRPGPASKTAMTLTGDPATIILTKNYGRTPPPLSDTMTQNATRVYMIPSSSVAGMNPSLIPISVSIPTVGQPQVTDSQQQHLYHSILPDNLGPTDNAESILPTPTSILPSPTSILPTPTSILPTPTSILPTPTSILPTPTSILPTPTSILPTPTSILPTPSYGAPNVTPVPPIGLKKKPKSHDIIRIRKSGQVELISGSSDIEIIETPVTTKTPEIPKITSKPVSVTPELLKIAPKPTSKMTETSKIPPKSLSKTPEVPKVQSKPVSKATEPIPKEASKTVTRSTRQSLLKEMELGKKPSPSSVSKPVEVDPTPAPAPRAWRVSSSSSGDSQPASPDDPLAILKDVIHIQADEYAAPAKPKHAPAQARPKVPNRKCFALSQGPSNPGVLSISTTASVTSQHTNNTSTKKIEVSKSRELNELVVDSVDLTESTPASSTVKKTDLKAKKPTYTVPSSAKVAINPSTSKNTPSASKILIVKTEKGATPKAGPKSWSESKKRPTASVESNQPKKKKLDQLMTLEDFDIDDIDDIIELD